MARAFNRPALVAALALLVAALLAAPAAALDAKAVARPSHEWESMGPADPRGELNLIVGLKMSNLDVLEMVALDVSDPSSPSYGRHLSLEQVSRLVQPPAAASEAVAAFLERSVGSRGEANVGGELVSVRATVAQASAMLGGAAYHTYRHRATGRLITRLARGAGYSLPEGVAEHVAFVSPTVTFPKLRALRRDSARPDALFVTPPFLQQLYTVPAGLKAKAPKNTQAVVSFIEQYWAPADLKTFEQEFANASVGQAIAKQVGPNDPTNPGDEASLDTQYLVAMGGGVPTWVWYTDDDNQPFLTWLLQMSNTTDVPLVNSVSYGEDEQGDTLDYLTAVNAQFAKLAARGVSVMIAAGDSGAGGGNCTDNDTYFDPDFPASSPWVTTVGGASGGTPGQVPTGETVDLIGGGGFSNVFSRPTWQDAAVKGYLSANVSGMPAPNAYNHSGRGYPDVAAQSEGFVIVLSGIPIPGVGGTSCATPTFSGIVALLNDLRLQAGKSPLGFLNPLIYKAAPANANAFNDFTTGSNMGCVLFGGFPAAPGWDAASGWGSPSYSLLAPLVEALP